MRAIVATLTILCACSDPPHKPIDAVIANTDSSSMLGFSLWVKADDDPSDGVTDSARGRTGSCTACPSLVPGKIDSAYQFTQDELTFVETPDLAPKVGFTIAAWVRVDSTDGEVSTILCKKHMSSTGFDMSYCLAIIPTTFMRLNYYKTGLQGGLGSPQIMVGRWHHVAMTWDGAMIMGYLDGRVDYMQPEATPQVYDSNEPLMIGNDPVNGLTPMKGALDDIRFYAYPLSAGEIAALAAM